MCHDWRDYGISDLHNMFRTELRWKEEKNVTGPNNTMSHDDGEKNPLLSMRMKMTEVGKRASL